MARTRNPKRGECGTCHWFEAEPLERQNPDFPRTGLCFAMPANAAPTLVPGRLGPQGREMEQKWQAINPPTNEIRRCSLWRPMGTQPPYDDHMRPGAKLETEDVGDAKLS